MINTHGIHPGHTNFNFEKFPEFWGIACFSLEGIGLIFPIRGSLKTQTTFKPLFNMICAFFIVIYIIFGVLCTLGLGDTTQEIIFHNFPKSYTSIYLLQFLYAFGIFITFPVYVQTTVNIIKRIDWFDKLFSGQKEYRNSTIARMMAITFYFGISLSGVNLLDFMNLSGSICNCYLAFILPVLAYITYFEGQGLLSKRSKIIHYTIMVVGITLSLAAILFALIDMSRTHHENRKLNLSGHIQNLLE